MDNLSVQAVYTLKQTTATTEIFLRKGGTTTVNLTSGAISKNLKDIKIRRAIVLPEDVFYGSPPSQGGKTLESERLVIIDKADIKVDIDKKNDRLVFENTVWEISRLSVVGNAVFLLKVRDLEGTS